MGAVTYGQEMRRCGKPACRGCRDGPSHGPYWYAYWREGGRLRKRYCGKIKPADADAERAERPANPALPSGLRIRLLGGLQVERGASSLSPLDWPRASARKLLALLLLHPSGLLREEVSETLWPERSPKAGEQALRSALRALRSVLEPAPRTRLVPHGATQCSRLPLSEQLLRLQLRPDDWVDITVFSAAKYPERLDADSLSDLVALYRGELLPEYRYEDWTATWRESLRSRWHALSLHLARRLIGSGRVAAGIDRLETVLADDGTQEEAARLLMTTLAEHGRRSEALHVYERLVHTLEAELAVTPDDLSRSLADRVRRGTPTHVAVPPRTSGYIAAHLKERIERLARQGHPITARRLARLSAYRALALESHGEPEEALSSIETGRLAISKGDFPAELARLLVTEAQVYCRQGHPGHAWETARQAEQLARQASELGLTAWALRLQAQAAQQLGQVERAIGLARSSTALYETMGARDQALQSRRIVALNVWYAGRFAEAEALYRRSLEEARALGDPRQQAYILCGLGSTLRAQGNLNEAEPHLLEALALATRLEEHFLILSAEYHLANLSADRADTALRGDPNGGAKARGDTQRRFERVISLARASHSDYMLVFGAIDLAMALIAWGRSMEARPLLGLARHTLDHLEDTVSPRGWVLLAEAELALAEGETQQALNQVASALPLLQLAAPAGLAQAHRVAAIAQTALGNCTQAASHWTASLAAAAHCDQMVEELRTRQAMQDYDSRDQQNL